MSKTEYYAQEHILTTRSSDTSIDLTSGQTKTLNVNNLVNLNAKDGQKINLENDVFTYSIDGTNYLKIGKQDYASTVATVSIGVNPDRTDVIGQAQGQSLKITANAPANMISCISNVYSTHTQMKFCQRNAAGTGFAIAGVISTNANVCSFSSTSDERLKEDFREIKVLDQLDQINVFDYKMIGCEQRHIGCKAQELHRFVPQAVTVPNDDETPYFVDYSKLVPHLLQANKELYAKIKSMELDIQLLKKIILKE